MSQNLFSQNSLLTSLQNKFSQLEDLSADFKQMTNGKTNLAGKFFFKQPNNLRIELKNLFIISDGVTVWNYNKRQKQVIISNYDENDQSMISFRRLIFDYPKKCEVTEKSGNEILLVPKENELNFKSAVLNLNDENLLRKITITDNNNTIITFEFSNYKLNQKIPKSRFNFLAPEGTKTIDLR